MGKFKVPSWLQGSSSLSTPAADGETKKQHRRSRSNFSHFISKSETLSTKAVPTATSTPEPGLSQIIALAKKISAETDKLDKYLKDHDMPNLGFGVDAAGDLPKLPNDVQKSRQEIVYATKELGNLVRGPRESVRWGVWSVSSNPTVSHEQH